MIKHGYRLWIGLLLIVALVSCQRSATPTPIPATVAPTPTATPIPSLPLTQTSNNPAAGVTVAYPEGWLNSTAANNTLISPEEAVIESQDFSQGPFVLLIAGTPEQLQNMAIGGETAEDVLKNLHDNFASTSGFLLTQAPQASVINDYTFYIETASLNFSGGQPYRIMLVTYKDDAVTAVGMFGAPEEQWPTLRPTYQNMLSSLRFAPPQPIVDADRGVLHIGESVDAELAPATMDVWTVDSAGGDFLMLTVESQAQGFDPHVIVIAPGGVILETNEDLGAETHDAGVSGLWLPRAGQYQVRVGASVNSGAYRITLEPAPDTMRYTLPDSGLGEATLDTPDQRHLWSFTGVAGQTVKILVDGERIDVFAELYGPTGDLLMADDDSGGGTDAYLEVPLPEDGIYHLLVYSRNLLVNGSYQISLEVVAEE